MNKSTIRLSIALGFGSMMLLSSALVYKNHHTFKPEIDKNTVYKEHYPTVPESFINNHLNTGSIQPVVSNNGDMEMTGVNELPYHSSPHNVSTDPDNKSVTNDIFLSNEQTVLNPAIYSYSGWTSINDKYYYFHPDSGLKATGLTTIENDRYYFHYPSGIALNGPQIIDDKNYYFDPATYKMKTGWVDTEDSNGRIQRQYYLSNGGYAKGLLKVGEYTYYFDPATGAAETGLQVIDDQYYYFDPVSFEMKTGWVDETKADGTLIKRYFYPEGGYAEGMQTIDQNVYYFQPGTGIAQSGQQVIDSKYYYFDPVTFVQRTGIVEAVYKDNVKLKHCFLPEGGKLSGWYEENGKTYYFSDQISGAVMVTGASEIDGLSYYFDPSTGERLEGVYPDRDGNYFYFTQAGICKTGLQQWNGNTYFFSEDGDNKAQLGLQSVDRDIYYFDNSTGAALKNRTITVSNISFVIGADGKVVNYYPDPGSAHTARTDVLMTCLSKVGDLYSYDLTRGFACGTYVRYVYSQVGITLPGKSDNLAQTALNPDYRYYKVGREITEDQLRPGDVIFWQLFNCDCPTPECSHWEHIHHVGIYLGNGKVIEAAQSRGAIVIEDMHSTDELKARYYVSYLDDENDSTFKSDTQDIAVPVNVSAHVNANMNVSISWDSLNNVDGFAVYRKGVNDSDFQQISLLSSQSRKYLDESIAVKEEYIYKIYGFKYGKDDQIVLSGEPDNEDIIQITVDSISGVNNLQAQSTETGTVLLTWNPVEEADGYLLYSIKNGKYQYLGQTASDTVNFTDIQPSDENTNYYYIFAYKQITDKQRIISEKSNSASTPAIR